VFPLCLRSWKWKDLSPTAAQAGCQTRRLKLLRRSGGPSAMSWSPTSCEWVTSEAAGRASTPSCSVTTVAIVDIKMPPTHTDEGLAAAQRILGRQPQTAVLVLSHYLDSRYAMRLLQEHAGGVGYLLKERISDLALLTDALARLNQRECVIDPTIVARLLRNRTGSGGLDELTPREHDVLALIAEGRSTKGICARLYLSDKTVEGHVAPIFQKLGIGESPHDHRRVLAVIAYLRATAI